MQRNYRVLLGEIYIDVARNLVEKSETDPSIKLDRYIIANDYLTQIHGFGNKSDDEIKNDLVAILKSGNADIDNLSDELIRSVGILRLEEEVDEVLLILNN